MRSRTRRLSLRLGAASALVLATLLASQQAQAQQTFRTPLAAPSLRISRSDNGDISTPISLRADDVVSWEEQGQRVFLFKGKVLLEQGVLQGRMQQAVIWVDMSGKKTTGAYRIILFGEGDVAMTDGSKDLAAGVASALIDLATRGDLRLKSNGGPIRDLGSKDNLRDAPLYQRAQAERMGPPAPSVSKSISGADNRIKLVQALEKDLPQAQPVQLPPPPPPPAQPAFPPPPPAQAQPPQVQPVPPGQPPAVEQPIPLPPPRPLGPTAPVGPAGGPRQLTIRPGSSLELQARNFQLPNGETAIVFTNRVIINVSSPDPKQGVLDIEADRLVLWTRDGFQQMLGGNKQPEGQPARSYEFYLAGNVEIRNQSGKETRTIRADEVFYDVNRNVAICLQADMEMKQPGLPDPMHLQSPEIRQLNAKLFELSQSTVNASKLPFDPGALSLSTGPCSLEIKTIPKKSIFGATFFSRVTGEPETHEQQLFRARNVVAKIEGVPFFYLPWLQGDAHDPLGPLEGVTVGYSRTFGATFKTTWDVYDLLGLDPQPGTRWRLNLDLLTMRGPVIGTDYTFIGKDLFGLPSTYSGEIKAAGMYDAGVDRIGGGRGEFVYASNPFRQIPVDHPDWRGRYLGQLNWQDLPGGFMFQGQLALISDRNYLDQYFNAEWMNDLNQETFAYVKQQQNNWAWTALAEPRLRQWITETQWLPKADGYLIGEKFFDLFTYSAHPSAGYAYLKPSNQQPGAYAPTDVRDETGRFDLWQELSLPFALGPFKVVPYGVLDTAYYTNNVFGNDDSRLYGGGGVRASIPFSRLYSDIQSDFFNLNGIYHKIVFSGNYYVAHSDTPYTNLPQLDRLNDDASDQALRDINPLDQFLYPGALGVNLQTNPLYDPQRVAIRRLLDNRVDTLDTIEVLQAGVRQRWQTKRGFPGNEHVIDWMTLDLTATYFPHPSRDNFGSNFAFLEYNWAWHVGDRTSIVSNGLADPIENGARVFNIGANINRYDRTNLYLGYRSIDPLDSKAFVGAITYAFSQKYALTASTTWDFAQKVEVYSLMLSRTGKDVQVSVGLGYNSTTSSFGFTFDILPNLLPANKRVQGAGLASMVQRQ